MMEHNHKEIQNFKNFIWINKIPQILGQEISKLENFFQAETKFDKKESLFLWQNTFFKIIFQKNDFNIFKQQINNNQLTNKAQNTINDIYHCKQVSKQVSDFQQKIHSSYFIRKQILTYFLTINQKTCAQYNTNMYIIYIRTSAFGTFGTYTQSTLQEAYSLHTIQSEQCADIIKKVYNSYLFTIHTIVVHVHKPVPLVHSCRRRIFYTKEQCADIQKKSYNSHSFQNF
eukprot:TRINITY_DN26526_c2_g1_i2.p1 TRINITY_DN26526_c2_g1~~TRINITY_DN26526_c2_g1_i2.p1  ORF type:complete len:229 (-),score=-9.40 TRINITY_DN26526_c2_g1_i2:144-830(-)